MKAISPEEQRDLILSVGIHQQERALIPIQVAELLEREINAGTPIKGISKEVMLDSSMIARFRRLLRLAPEIQHLVGWVGESKVSFSTASEIARLDSPEDHTALVKSSIEHKLSKNEVIQIIETKNKFGKSINECTEEIINMRPKVVKKYLYIGAIKSTEVKDRLSKMSQQERDKLFREIVTENYSHLPYWEGMLGLKGFNLIGDEELDQSLRNLDTDLEATVNDTLELRLKSFEQSRD
ncbi:hypothetical protein ACFLX6_00350 [Chloroflexota bacterium]